MPALPPLPYRGIQPFRYADSALFFAREEETRTLLQLVSVYRGVMLYGDSGAGKSSLINAGLLPASARLGFQPERVRVQPRPDAEIVVERISVGDEGAPYLHSSFTSGDQGSLLHVLSCEEFALRLRDVASPSRLLLVFDQFEELVTLFEEAGEQRSQQRIADMLGVLIREELPVKLLFVFREDYLAKIKPLLAAAPELVDQALRLRPPDAEALQTIIRGPFERHPGHFDRELGPGVAERLRVALADRFGSGDVSLSEVQTVCLRLWRSEEPDALLDARGVQGLLEDYLGEELDRLPDDLRYAAGALLSQMVTSAGTRNVISAEDLIAHVQDEERIPRERLEHALDLLERESKLVQRERRRDLYLYEITSEFLVPWISRRRQELIRNQERRRLHRRLLLSGAIVASVALVAVVASVGFVWALGQRAEARDLARSAEAREFAAKALSQLATDPEQSLRLALKAAELEPSKHEDVLRRALLDSRLLLSARIADPVEALATGAGAVAAASAKTITLYDSSLAETARLPLDGRVLELRGDGAVVVSGRTITILDPLTGRIERRVKIPERQLPVRDVESGRLLAPIAAPKTIRGVALGPKRTLLAISDGTRRTVIVNALNGEGRHVLEQPSAVTALRFGPAAGALAVGGSDGSVQLWRVATGAHRATLRFGHVGHVTDIAFSPRATLLATASTDGTARVWRVGSAQPVSVLGHENFVNDVEFSADGSFVVTASKDGTARVWSAEDGESIATLRGHGDSVSAAAFLSVGRRVVTAGVGTLRIWDSVRQPPLTLVRSFGVPVTRVRFAGGGFEAVTDDGRLHVLSIDGEELAQRDAAEPAVERSAAGATVTIEGKTAVVRRADGRKLVLRGHRDIVTSAHFSPDGADVVTASRDHDSIVWDTRRGVPRRKLLGHFAIVSDARFSPDGRWIVTAGPGKSGLWDASTGRLIYLLQGHEGILLSASFDPASRRIVTGGRDGTVQTYRCTICGEEDELIVLARARLAAAAPR